VGRQNKNNKKITFFPHPQVAQPSLCVPQADLNNDYLRKRKKGLHFESENIEKKASARKHTSARGCKFWCVRVRFHFCKYTFFWNAGR
jgi:hypothetical protein